VTDKLIDIAIIGSNSPYVMHLMGPSNTQFVHHCIPTALLWAVTTATTQARDASYPAQWAGATPDNGTIKERSTVKSGGRVANNARLREKTTGGCEKVRGASALPLRREAEVGQRVTWSLQCGQTRVTAGRVSGPAIFVSCCV